MAAKIHNGAFGTNKESKLGTCQYMPLRGYVFRNAGNVFRNPKSGIVFKQKSNQEYLSCSWGSGLSCVYWPNDIVLAKYKLQHCSW
jgi:hypothetical protein